MALPAAVAGSHCWYASGVMQQTTLAQFTPVPVTVYRKLVTVGIQPPA